jgi:hypothetical protein
MTPMSASRDVPRVEAARDQDENAFTAILRRLYDAVPAVIAAVFVDMEGESIDYVAAIEPYEAKLAAAHMHMLLNGMCLPKSSATLGETFAFELVSAGREVWVRRFCEEYVLVVLLEPGFDASELRDAIATAGRGFRHEAGLDTPPWESREQLSVRLRASAGWNYAPVGFSVAGERFGIAAVLGRWTEPARPGEPSWVCFRVRTQHGQELTLAHDERTEAWWVRDS